MKRPFLETGDMAAICEETRDVLENVKGKLMQNVTLILSILKNYGALLVGALLTGIGGAVSAGWKEPVWLIGLTAALSFLAFGATLAHPVMAAKLAAKGKA